MLRIENLKLPPGSGDAALRAQVDAQVIERLQTLCGWQYDAYSLGWQASAGERPVRAVGMLGAFPQGSVRFSVTGAPRSQSLPNVSKQTLILSLLQARTAPPLCRRLLF